uniref:Protocadherin alpha 8-like n=1 Tax=Denticeps clupeoides TaxID=299321 RepID=A0AAY4DL17_9TELE
MEHRGETRGRRRVALGISLLLCFAERISAQVKYSVPEETKEGFVVGNIAKDLGLDVTTLEDRRFRIVSGPHDMYFQVKQNNGALYVQKRIDREELCEGNEVCAVNVKVVVENPLEVHYVGVEIADINDHSPSFAENEQRLRVPENTPRGARFEIQTARDPDAGMNSIRSYRLLQNDHFELELQDTGYGHKSPFLVLQKALDRETAPGHGLQLTALDGGSPPRSSTLNITVSVLDVNDNRPVCSRAVYTVSLAENAAVGTVVMKVNATDSDEGMNGEVEYALSRTLNRGVHDIFTLDSVTGEMRVKGDIDFEKNQLYSFNIQAADKGQPPTSTDCRVIVKVVDMNDNEPEIEVTSLSNVISEDSKPGSVISLISVRDVDSGVNGQVVCTIPSNLPFELKPSVQENMYSLITKAKLDRETISQYDITITATDLGVPPLTAMKTLNVQISDVNDNVPEFPENPVELYILENNVPGTSIFCVSAHDNDMNENAVITYDIIRGVQNDVASFLNIDSDNGVIYALKSFDFETVKSFQFLVKAKDSGSPSLSSNVTVNVFILDQNDNSPVILSPVNANGSAEAVEELPRNVNVGHLVTKVRAYDADMGYNGWLLYSLQEVRDHTLFGLDRYTGQIRTLRSFAETDDAEHKLVVMVKDNGNVSFLATATVTIKLVEPKEAFAASDLKNTVKDVEENDIKFYLIITLGSVSVLFVLSIVILIVMQCSKPTDFSSKYLQDTNYDGTLCHSIQYRSGEKRYMLVGPRMSIGSTLVPGSNGNTLVLPDRASRASTEVRFHTLNTYMHN